MTPEPPETDDPVLSVVIPSYNSAPWLPTTLEALATAIERAGITTQVLIVDDGSTDETQDVIASIAGSFPGSLEVVRQENQGRFIARWEGLQRARANLVLLLDSRVLITRDALAYAISRIDADPLHSTWNANVRTDPSARLIGLFWDVPTYVFWGAYLRSPRPFDLTATTFDSAPKGTTMFLAPRTVLKAAFEQAWPTSDARLVSDDTKLLRWIAETRSIRLDPSFSAIYRPRTTVREFVRHTYDRGTLFVDSYGGTSVLRSGIIVAMAVGPVVLLAALVVMAITGAWAELVTVLAAVVALAVLPVIPAAINRCPPRSILAYLYGLPIFAGPFWLGLVRGVIVHRRAFGSRRQRAHGAFVGKEHA